MAKVWIVDRSHGQLGNRLMLLSAVYAWCLEDGHELYYPGLHRYAHHFPALDGQWFNSPTNPSRCGLPLKYRAAFQKRFVDVFRGLVRMKVISGRLRPPRGNKACSFRPTDANFPTLPRAGRGPGRYVVFSWRFNNPVGLVKYRPQIKALLAPTPQVDADAAAFVATLPARSAPGGGVVARIAVHIRRTDYKTFLGGKHYHSIDRYKAEMSAVAALLREQHGIDSHFVLFSDEPLTAGQFEGFSLTISGGTMMQDLFRMSRLDGAIGPVSTFSTYAMYLAGASVYHFGPWADEDGFDWVYNGLAVTRDAEVLAADIARVVRGSIEEPHGEPGASGAARGRD